MKKLISAVLVASLTACAIPQRQPIIDWKEGQTQLQYSVDMNSCTAFADQISVGDNALAGAGVGAIFGALLSIAAGGRDFAKQGAAVGALSGLAAGTSNSANEKHNVIQSCMRGRGWNVLN